jgi:deoxyribodipyrimidine photo-lyase
MSIETALVLFNRDLRVHDHPALAAAAKAGRTVPLFVFDERLLGSRFAAPNRVAFMLEALRDLDERLRRAGGRLYVRRGDPVLEAIAVAQECGASAIHASADWSHRAWSELPWRQRLGAPRRLRVPAKLKTGRMPGFESINGGRPSAGRLPGGESEGRKLMRSFLRDGLGSYENRHDDLPGDGTSRLSAYIRWGLRLAAGAGAGGNRPAGRGGLRAPALLARLPPPGAGGDPVPPPPRLPAAARPLVPLEADPGGVAGGPHRLPAGRRGDAAASCGGLHAQPGADDRRLLPLQGPLRRLARWGLALLGNWQWMAGTGNDTRPNRVLNPVRQAQRFDPKGTYVRRYLPELESVEGKAILRPWLAKDFDRLDYPPPLVDHDEAAAAFRAYRGA